MNPSGQPFPNQFGGAPPPPGGGGGAAEALNVPGILFIVFGSISVLYGIYGLTVGGVNEAQMSQMLSDPNLPPQAKDFLKMLVGPISKVLGSWWLSSLLASL